MASYNKKEHHKGEHRSHQDGLCPCIGNSATATPEERTVLGSLYGLRRIEVYPLSCQHDGGHRPMEQVGVGAIPLAMELHRTIRDNTTSESQYKSYMQSLKTP